MIWTIPNILTIFRLIAAPGVALAYVFLLRPYADVLALGLFILASLTDYLDGYLARKWNQTTKLGTMLDPIADKAMVVIALVVIVGVGGMDPLIVLPTAIIMFREVFVSGLREFLGDTAGTLKVTKLAKWKTTVQMVAIAALFAFALFQSLTGMAMDGMDPAFAGQILAGIEPDLGGLKLRYDLMVWCWWAGVVLLWIAAVLTAITGYDYFRKALPYLREPA
jgi:CDP-diacylglycerol--glycerol-3-phosphate 3-phosphatidyltransferase